MSLMSSMVSPYHSSCHTQACLWIQPVFFVAFVCLFVCCLCLFVCLLSFFATYNVKPPCIILNSSQSWQWLWWIFACELWAWCCEEPCCGWTAQSWLASPNTGIPPATNSQMNIFRNMWSNILTIWIFHRGYKYSVKERWYVPTLQSLYAHMIARPSAVGISFPWSAGVR